MIGQPARTRPPTQPRARAHIGRLGRLGRLQAWSVSIVLPWLMAAPVAAAPPLPQACDADFQHLLLPLPAAVKAAQPTAPAQAVWLDRQRLRWPQAEAGGRFVLYLSARGQLVAAPGAPVRGADAALALQPDHGALPRAAAERFKWVAPGVTLALRHADLARLPAAHRGQVLLVREDAQGRVLQLARIQAAGALDDLYAAAENLVDLGVTPTAEQTRFRLWAPTAQRVWLCHHASSQAPALSVGPMRRDARTGSWQAQLAGDLSGGYYTYLVDVFVPGAGLVRNRVTDPYSLSLSPDSRHSWIGRLDAPDTQPAGWASTPRPTRVARPTDAVIYELHVRDFSIGDRSVSAVQRGKYGAFAATGALGMRHLRALAEAGLTDVHLLPIFDLATVPETGCTTPPAAALAAAAPDSGQQQARVMADARGDCFNWGYDPLHFTAPDGSYASDGADGATRIRELRTMIQALHQAGLRVGMDVVYNHTSASGQNPRSVLDRIVPGYYQRLDAEGQVETSTCCDNTATENRMMAKLMIDSAVVWAREHRIDSFRFDLMGHQPRAAMLRLQAAVNQAAGRPVHLIGEGWNFGEVKDGARFVQAAQGQLAGSGIATFSDRARDAVRGGGCCDDPQATVQRQGWINGLHLARNAHAAAAGLGSRDELLRAADLVRVGLAGTLAEYRMPTHDGTHKALAQIDYAGQGAGYASQPDEVVNYVENHDNPTLFDLNVLKLAQSTSREDRARVQVLGLAVTAFSQGIAYFHAGGELLRSKSLDRNSFDSGDWFNRIDWSLVDNGFGSGLPPAGENGPAWPLMKPLLADPGIKPGTAEITFTRDAFFDLLRLRASSSLFRLPSADAVSARLRFLHTGPAQHGGVIVGHLDGRGLAGAGFVELLYVINVAPQAVEIDLEPLRGRDFVLHPVHRAAGAADKRPATQSRWDAARGQLSAPARTALVYVLE